MASRGSIFVRNVIFGVEDSLVSTVGLLSGIAVSAAGSKAVLLTGVVYIAVEGFSMAVGSFLSEESAEEYSAGGEVASKSPILGAVVMLVSFVVAGLIPLLPYVFLQSEALSVSIIASIIALFILGLVHGKVERVGMLKHGIRLAILGGGAILIGVVVSRFFGVS